MKEFWEKIEFLSGESRGGEFNKKEVEAVACARGDLVLACNFLAQLRDGKFDDRNWPRVAELIADNTSLDYAEEIAGLIAHGLNNAEIAERINCDAEDMVSVIRKLMEKRHETD
jgi:DNA-binding NarL/FixJ family response regulator